MPLSSNNLGYLSVYPIPLNTVSQGRLEAITPGINPPALKDELLRIW